MPCHLSEVFEAVLGGSLTFTLSNYHKLVQIFPNERSARIFKIGENILLLPSYSLRY